MHEVMRPSFYKLRASPRFPSFAGEGLPERIRSTVFLFLGLTAATGLGLVAVFAQLGPLPAPEPMPIAAPKRTGVAEAVALGPGIKPPAVGQATTVPGLDSAPWPKRCSRCT
jgi:hypothetical protein